MNLHRTIIIHEINDLIRNAAKKEGICRTPIVGIYNIILERRRGKNDGSVRYLYTCISLSKGRRIKSTKRWVHVADLSLVCGQLLMPARPPQAWDWLDWPCTRCKTYRFQVDGWFNLYSGQYSVEIKCTARSPRMYRAATERRQFIWSDIN